MTEATNQTIETQIALVDQKVDFVIEKLDKMQTDLVNRVGTIEKEKASYKDLISTREFFANKLLDIQKEVDACNTAALAAELISRKMQDRINYWNGGLTVAVFVLGILISIALRHF